jgi:hypothetical protein
MWRSKSHLVRVVTLVLGALSLGPGVWGSGSKVHRYRYSDIDMPVSLAVGTVRTPEFAAKGEAYYIMMQVERRLPYRDLQCMMGVKNGTEDYKECPKAPLIEVEWTVWDRGQVVSQGSNSGFGAGSSTDEHLSKFLGMFKATAGKTYSVQVNFTKDGTALDVANPHLIVVRVRYH